jgi:hypothetical protein
MSMNRFSRQLVLTWTGMGSRFLPFADAATPDLPLSRLLRLSLFQASVGMALVLLVGTLNRVMIVELGVPASLVAVMIAVPVLYAPFRALVGYRSDNHRSALGWRRVPYIWMGTLMQFGGLAVMPFALLVLSGRRRRVAPGRRGSARPPPASCFLLVGAGLHTTQTAGLALATDLAPVESQPKVVGLMYVMLLAGSIVSALVFGALLSRLQSGAPDPGDPGLGGRDDGAEHPRAVEAGDPAIAAARAAGLARRRRSPTPGAAVAARRARRLVAIGSARWPSACRTCCSSPTAGRCSAWASAPRPR